MLIDFHISQKICAKVFYFWKDEVKLSIKIITKLRAVELTILLEQNIVWVTLIKRGIK